MFICVTATQAAHCTCRQQKHRHLLKGGWKACRPAPPFNPLRSPKRAISGAVGALCSSCTLGAPAQASLPLPGAAASPATAGTAASQCAPSCCCFAPCTRSCCCCAACVASQSGGSPAGPEGSGPASVMLVGLLLLCCIRGALKVPQGCWALGACRLFSRGLPAGPFGCPAAAAMPWGWSHDCGCSRAPAVQLTEPEAACGDAVDAGGTFSSCCACNP
jgi:hypothetical protein